MHWAESRKKRIEGNIPQRSGNPWMTNLEKVFFHWFPAMFCHVSGNKQIHDDNCGGYLVNLDRAKAAEFSFLLGLITLTAAAGYKSVTKWSLMSQYLALGPLFY